MLAAVIFSIICVAAYSFINGMNGGYALSFVSFFLVVSSVAVAGFFLRRARMMEIIMNTSELLVHWTYPEEIARISVEREYREYMDRNHALFIVTGGMLVAVALFFLIFVEDGGFETGVFLLIFTIFLFTISRVTPGLERKQALKTPHEAFIAQKGIIYEGVVYPFRSFLMNMDGVSLQKAKGKNPSMIIFSFNQLAGLYIARSFDIMVPVPSGEENKAQEIVRALGGDIEVEEISEPHTIICKKCSSPINNEDGFCELCGKKV